MKFPNIPGFQLITNLRRRSKAALIILSPIIISAIFAPLISPHNPLQTNIGPPFVPPSLKYPMGTDQLGSDILSQIIFGARTGLLVGVSSSLIVVLIAFTIGITSGYLGGAMDEILMRSTDVILSIPSFILIIFVVVIFGSTVTTITLIIGLVSWPVMARIVRSQVLSLKEREFVLATKALGAGKLNIMMTEILPNLWLGVIPAITLQIGYGILTEAGLSFLGLGDPGVASWGRTLALATTSIYAGDWWPVVFPGVAIAIAIIGVNLLGDGLSESLKSIR